ncbi:hypothetical protein CNMCM7691_003148 [Aspergillus felis]|uniref:Major facilitator superfamily (MFS) profile domain-containing protein n=1 Tax=Aspergillus felis TaxID=1287682 RepID=A0A8H6V9T2_9EURO|nr:hypothetical protein CNMCM7691_003148 [Aspergillus felis]
MSDEKETIGPSNPAQTTTDRQHLQLTIRSSDGSTKKDNRHLTIGAGKAFPPPLIDPENYVVDFDGPDDPEHPYNWSYVLKYAPIAAIFAPGAGLASKTFGVGPEVGTLGTTLYILGFASGPLIWAPTSELIGRRWPLTIGMLGVAIFTISAAVCKDIQTLIICRFFAGLFGASQLSVVPAVLSDVYNNAQRGTAITLYSLTVFVGPFSAPFIGGFVSSSSLGWRWTLYISSFMGFASVTLFILLLKETYAPLLLVAKAAAIRRQTSNWGVHAKLEEVEVDFHELIQKYFTRPLKILITEPIVLLISLYMSFIYGLVYALLEAYPYVFESVYGMNPGNSSQAKKLAANDNIPVPEWRLSPAIVGAPVFTVGIFWFGWTSFTSRIHWMVPTAAGVLIGFGVLCIFLPCFNYLVDSYLPLAASTVAANIILRSAVAAGFPLFSKQMFERLGVQWAATLLGCLAATMIPIPLVFRAYGPLLRKKSQLAP